MQNYQKHHIVSVWLKLWAENVDISEQFGGGKQFKFPNFRGMSAKRRKFSRVRCGAVHFYSTRLHSRVDFRNLCNGKKTFRIIECLEFLCEAPCAQPADVRILRSGQLDLIALQAEEAHSHEA